MELRGRRKKEKEKERRQRRTDGAENKKVLISRKGSGESRVVYCRCIGFVWLCVSSIRFLCFFSWLLESARCTPSLFIILIHDSREGVVLLVSLADELDCSS